MTSRFAIILSTVGLLAGPLSADDVRASDPFGLLQLMQGEGFDVQLTTDSYGDPKITGRSSNTNWSLVFYGCSNNRNCTHVRFGAGYDLANGVSQASMNEWNRNKLFGKAHVDSDNDPFIRMPVNLDKGVTEANFKDTLNWWTIVVEEFEEHIDWQQ